MKIDVSGGGGPTFTVKNDKREDLVVPSTLSGYEAAHLMAEWLSVVPIEPAVEEPKPKKSIAPKADT